MIQCSLWLRRALQADAIFSGFSAVALADLCVCNQKAIPDTATHTTSPVQTNICRR